jgi:hypothetical protein
MSQTNLGFTLGDDIGITDQILAADGTPQSIAGWGISFSVNYTDIVIPGIAGGSVTITDPANGIVTIVIPASATVNLTARTYQYKIRRTDPGNAAELSTGALCLFQP